MNDLRASIDLGTNTCLLLLARWNTEGRQVEKVLLDRATVVRLGQGVDKNRILSDEGMSRTRDCLKKYAAELKAAGFDPRHCRCVATSSARDAKNSREFFGQVEAETGFHFRVISGEDEARFSFAGALMPGMHPESTVVIDIGGGSTEFVTVGAKESLDIGSVRLTERYFGTGSSSTVSDAEFWNCRADIDGQILRLKPWRERLGRQTELLGVAGTVTTLAAWFQGMKTFDPLLIDQTTLGRGDVHRMVEELKMRTPEERLSLPGVEPGRADVLLAGAMILWRAMELLNFSACRVSSRGLRFGVLMDEAGK